MQLHYNILWIDNDLPEYIERGVLDDLNAYLLDLGFKGNIIPILDEENLNDILDKHKFDLIISDYELDNTTGIKIVEHIRDKYLTEILFYTAKISQHTEEELRDSLKNIDRITIHLGRDSLLNRIENLIYLTLNRLLELNATRGLITSVTSELDVDMETISMSLLDRCDNVKIVEIFNDLHKQLVKKSDKDKKDLQTFFDNNDYTNYFIKLDAFRKWCVLKELMKNTYPEDSSCEVLKDYYNEVIKIRNKFAHAKAIEKQGKLYLAGFGPEGDQFEYDESSCIGIRKRLIAHQENFKNLNKLLGLT